MKIEVFIDQDTDPRQILDPPEAFRLDTTGLADGPHVLRLKAIDTDGTTGLMEIPFSVRNGPGIAVGIREGDVLKGQVSVLINAYSSKVGDVFEPVRIETPSPIPTWAWLVFLLTFAWGMWYLGIEYKTHQEALAAQADTKSPGGAPASPAAGAQATWKVLGEQVYGNTCSACHQVTGEGLVGAFPPIKGSTVVTAEDPTEHIRIILNGLSGKVIEGSSYESPMPGFGSQLNDEEIAAVVNHERTNWGNAAPTTTPEKVATLRK
ncbi:MAG: c-type cytochrome [bacterium]